MAEPSRIDKRRATDRLRSDYAHVGLYDTAEATLWIARKRVGVRPIRLSHAQMLLGGARDTSVPEKDRFLCYWYHTPHSGEGLIHGYPIEWEEAHLMVRLDPRWDYQRQRILPSTDMRRVEANIDRQFEWGRKIFQAYLALKPKFPVSWHMIGPRPADSMFYVRREEPG